MLLRQGVEVTLLNTQKQTQGGYQIEETKKCGSNERTKQNPRKRTKQNGDNQPIRYRVQNTGYQDAPGTHWKIQHYKKGRYMETDSQMQRTHWWLPKGRELGT